MNKRWIIVLGLVCGCASPQKPSNPIETQAHYTGPVIDINLSSKFNDQAHGESGILRSYSQLKKEMKNANVVGGVAISNEKMDGYRDLRGDHIIHCRSISQTTRRVDLEKDLKSGEFGCIKIWLGYIPRFAGDAHYQPAYELAKKYDVPVVFHTGDTSNPKSYLKYADPLTIDGVAVQHPEVRFVLAHCGNPWIESAAEVAYKNPNVYLECSALLTGDFSKKPEGRIDQYVVRPMNWVYGYMEDSSKLLFASHWPTASIQAYKDAYEKAIPAQDWQAVFYDNAVKVFKLKAAK